MDASRDARYEVEEELGRGGSAAVYRAHDRVLDREVALKILSGPLANDPEFVARFEREARLAARLHHPAIVTIYDFGALPDGRPFIAMHLLEGQGLERLLASRQPLAPARALRITRQMAEALDFVHAHGTVHRDVKPSNVIVGGGDTVTLTDFGIARAYDSARMTLTGLTVGTPRYMSPEQIRGEDVTGQSDIYALGVVAFEMLTGRVPFEGDGTALMFRIVHEAPPPVTALNAGLPAAVAAVLARALEKDPERRWESAGAFATALEDALREPVAAPAPPAVRVEAPPRRIDPPPAAVEAPPPAVRAPASSPVVAIPPRPRPVAAEQRPPAMAVQPPPVGVKPPPLEMPAPPPSPPAAPAKRGRRGVVFAAIAGAAVVLGGAGAFFAFGGGSSSANNDDYTGDASAESSETPAVSPTPSGRPAPGSYLFEIPGETKGQSDAPTRTLLSYAEVGDDGSLRLTFRIVNVSSQPRTLYCGTERDEVYVAPLLADAGTRTPGSHILPVKSTCRDAPQGAIGVLKPSDEVLVYAQFAAGTAVKSIEVGHYGARWQVDLVR